ncbi:unnamed protein product [Heterobilharzia americana]|nr:unnamed protein product [Heterobilharzia americana]
MAEFGGFIESRSVVIRCVKRRNIRTPLAAPVAIILNCETYAGIQTCCSWKWRCWEKCFDRTICPRNICGKI